MEFNKEEINDLKEIVEEWLSEGFLSVSELTEVHYSIIRKLGIKREQMRL